MMPDQAFRLTSELLALRRVYAALAPVAFLDDERAAVDTAFRDRELWLVVTLRALDPVLLLTVNARLACGAPAIRPPATEAPPPEPLDVPPTPMLTADLHSRIH